MTPIPEQFPKKNDSFLVKAILLIGISIGVSISASAFLDQLDRAFIKEYQVELQRQLDSRLYIISEDIRLIKLKLDLLREKFQK